MNHCNNNTAQSGHPPQAQRRQSLQAKASRGAYGDCPRWQISLFAAAIAVFSAAASADQISGVAKVVDGDTIKVADRSIRIEGIDAPEIGQSCARSDGRNWACGKAAATELKNLIGDSNVTCEASGEDQHGRLIAVCRVNDEDLGRQMVKSGHAVAFIRYSETYIPDEVQSRSAKRGIWATEFDRPADYRAQRWELAKQSAPDPNCPIKGNINRHNERIYHAPWSRMYNRTKISTGKGEKWFCSEGEAVAAGWRAPLYD